MQVFDFVTSLNQQGIRLWADHGTLKINAPKGTMTAQLQADLVAHKAEILNFLRCPQETGSKTCTDLSLPTLGRLIGGADPASGPGTAAAAKVPVIDPTAMARRLKITFRPLPEGFADDTILAFRRGLEIQLRQYGVTVIPWEAATRDFEFCLPMPLIRPTFKMRVVRSEIDAVIDVERPINRHNRCLAEHLYRLYRQFWARGQALSFGQIARLTGWAEDHVMQRLEDPTATQVILINRLSPSFVDPQVPYSEKIGMGVEALISHFSEIIIGVSKEQISILNMNLSDSLFSRNQLKSFVLRSLIPKIYVPIAPLPMGQFQLADFDPSQSPYVTELITLSQAMAKTGLLPSGFKLAEAVRRRSHRDIVNTIVNGRTGVSYGFVAYAEPPIYVGERDISEAEWQRLGPVEGFDDEEVRQNHRRRRYVKTRCGEATVYKQIPDIWLVCSRSGANKTALQPECDVLRLGLTNKLFLQLPRGIDPTLSDIKPSYDTYVMVAIALSAALYAPELIEQGAPIVHFHGYMARSWFQQQEAYAGVENPSVPCGTFESGVFNFLSMNRLVHPCRGPLNLAALIEPDHGSNIIAKDLDYLLKRLDQGLADEHIELGGKHFASLVSPVSPKES